MSAEHSDVKSEVVKVEVKHMDAGNPPIRFLALRLTTEDRGGIRVQGEWSVLSAPLAGNLVSLIQKSLDAPQPPVSPTTTAH